MTTALDPKALSASAGLEDVEVQLMGGRRIHGLRCGKKGGDPWLLLHGWLDNAAAFIPMLPVLHQQIGPDSEMVAVDMAGHGCSDHSQGDYVLTDYAADALLVADALGWPRFSLVGHSLGGLVASLAAGTQPERIVRLVMLDISGPTGQQAHEAPAILAKSVAWAAQRSTGDKSGGSRLKVFSSVEEAAKQRADKNIGGPMSLPNAMLMASRGVIARTNTLSSEEAGFVWKSDPNLLMPPLQALTPDAAFAFLRRIKCPTLVLVSLDGIYRELLHKGGRVRGPRPHAFSRLFGTYLLLVWVALRIASRMLAPMFPARSYKLDKFAKSVLEGYRIGASLRAISGLHLEELQSGGHHFHMTLPEETARTIARWSK